METRRREPAHRPAEAGRDLPKAILSSALAAFEENGYHGTSVRDIARRVGVTVPTLYYHFDNKQAILVELLTSSMELVLAHCRMALAEAGRDPADRYSALVRSLVLILAQPGRTGTLDAEMRGLEPENRARYVALRDQLEDELDAVISAGAAQGVFTTPYPREAARAVLAMCQAVPRWFDPDGEMDSAELAERYVTLTLGTVGHRPAGRGRRRSRTASEAATATAPTASQVP